MKNASLKEIKEILKEADFPDIQEYIDILSKDTRKGAQQLALRLESERDRLDKLLSFEKKAYNYGYRLIAGVDEAGRGPLAGPIVAAAVLFPGPIKIRDIDDSKRLSSSKREYLYEKIKDKALHVKVSTIDVDYIDKYNIFNANTKAIKKAVTGLGTSPEFVLIDGNDNISFDFPHKCIKKGDRKSLSIAAASIIAKVERDRLMVKYDEMYPEYKFAKHKGYGTAEHIEKIGKYGLSPIHRKSFKIKGISN
ncbi:MAG TPA: ribonuclease HII [Thermoanaerobacterales bacterium]|nr:ribonuclease HII [Thermoanaerobacterales bacterium]